MQDVLVLIQKNIYTWQICQHHGTAVRAMLQIMQLYYMTYWTRLTGSVAKDSTSEPNNSIALSLNSSIGVPVVLSSPKGRDNYDTDKG
jgi:hypothetical protein